MEALAQSMPGSDRRAAHGRCERTILLAQGLVHVGGGGFVAVPQHAQQRELQSDPTADAKLLAQTERSAAEDIDMVEAVSTFSTRQTSYDAALKAYSMVQKLSLFDYIR